MLIPDSIEILGQRLNDFIGDLQNSKVHASPGKAELVIIEDYPKLSIRILIGHLGLYHNVCCHQNKFFEFGISQNHAKDTIVTVLRGWSKHLKQIKQK